jgi:uncharacterized YigZ family protein
MTDGNISDFFRTIRSNHRSEIKISKSTFIANAFPVTSKEEAEKKLNEIRKEFFNARHHPYAYKTGSSNCTVKTSDDGEPSGTSGKPILNAIEKHDVTDILIVVTRYFGGIKLGTGGLKRAYFESADLCLSKCEITEILLTKELSLECDYHFISSVINLIEKYGSKIKENTSGENASLIIELRLSAIKSFTSDFTNLTSGKGNIKILA